MSGGGQVPVASPRFQTELESVEYLLPGAADEDVRCLDE